MVFLTVCNKFADLEFGGGSEVGGKQIVGKIHRLVITGNGKARQERLHDQTVLS